MTLINTVLRPLFYLGLLAGLAAPLAAGRGYKIVDGRARLLVYLEDPSADRIAWQAHLSDAAYALYDATEGELLVEEFALTSCPALKDEADIVILRRYRKGSRRCALSLACGGRANGNHGAAVYADDDIAFCGLGNGLTAGRILAHELAHYFWDLGDEYKGERRWHAVPMFLDECDNLCAPQLMCFDGSTSPTGCLMSASTCTPGASGRTEFCDAGTHVGWRAEGGVIYKNRQEAKHGEPCWATIANHPVNALPPHFLPVPGNPGWIPPTFRDLDGALATVLVLDTSASMAGVPLDLASYGASVAVGLACPGQMLGVVTFSSSASTLVPISAVDAAFKGMVDSALEGIDAGGRTAIGRALRRSKELLAEVGACSKSIVLLTDGRSNVGPEPEEVLPEIVEAGIRVDTIGLGDPLAIKADVLQEIARQTGGLYSAAQTPHRLPEILSRIFTSLKGGTALMAQSTLLLPRETRTFSVDVPPETQVVAFSLGLRNSTTVRMPSVFLLDPNGGRIDLDNHGPGIDVYRGARQLVYQVASPAPGAWVATITSEQGLAASIDFLASVTDPGLVLEPVAAPSLVRFPRPTPLQVLCGLRGESTGAEVHARVIDPGGSTLSSMLKLHDDGHPFHGDEEAGDGIFSTLFAGYTDSGSYTFVFDATGLTEDGDRWQASETHSLTIEGVPGFIPRGIATLASELTDSTQSLRSGQSTGAVLLDFFLELEADEDLMLEELGFDLSGDGVLTCGLAMDSNGNGELDPGDPFLVTPETQLATNLALRGPRGGPLAMLPAGRHRFFLVAGIDASAPVGPGAGLLAREGAPHSGPSPAVALAGGLFLACLAVTLSRRRLPSAVATALLGALCCGSCSSRPGDPRTLSARLRPEQVVLSGATSGRAVEVLGDEIVRVTTIG